MRNFIYFLASFTATILIVLFTSLPANAEGGAGGSWGCPDGWTTNDDGTCSFNGGGGSTGGGGGGGSWDGGLPYTIGARCDTAATSAEASCEKYSSIYRGGLPTRIVGDACQRLSSGTWLGSGAVYRKKCDDFLPEPDEPDEPDLPEFPDLPAPTPDCNICARLYDIQLKLNVLKNQDINIINNIVNDMQQNINNIDNSITDLSVNQEITNNYLTNIDNSIGDLITNINNNNITNNEILNTVNNINNYMNDYSLKLGDIQLALGDISIDLDNTNRLVLDLGVDLDFIKNKMIADDSKDYTPYLEEIIRLLAPCVPTEGKSCGSADSYDDTDLMALLNDLNDFVQADFVADDSDTKIDVQDMTDIDLDRDLIKFGVASCPPDNEFNTMVNGFSFSGGFKHKPLCDFFTMLAPFIKAFGGFSAALILGGGLRK